MHEVVCRIEGCSICGEDTTYSLRFGTGNRITIMVSGCRASYNERYKTGYVSGSEVTRENAMRLLQEHAADMERRARYFSETQREADEARNETNEAIANLVLIWQPALTREELELAAAPLLRKYARRR